jgi:hypothetical protein
MSFRVDPAPSTNHFNSHHKFLLLLGGKLTLAPIKKDIEVRNHVLRLPDGTYETSADGDAEGS